MKYMLMIYNRPGFVESLTDEERKYVFGEVDSIMAKLTESGELVGGQALADPSNGRTIRLSGGQVAVTDGPYLEGKEQFVGYIAVDCESLERAIEIAESWPDIKLGGVMEVRAIMDDAGAEM